jgi:hypothetical protein
MELETKEFPDNYPSDAVALIEGMCFNDDIEVIGSMGLRSQLYAGDYDLNNTVRLNMSEAKALHKLRVGFQSIVKHLESLDDVFIGDIKAGEVEEWRVVPKDFKDFNLEESRAKLKSLYDDKVIDKEEYNDAKESLKSKSEIDYLVALGDIKFQVVRWKPEQVKANKNVLRDGRTMTLEEAFVCPAVVKLDVVSVIQRSRFTEFSVLYSFFNNGKALNPTPRNLKKEIENSIKTYQHLGNYFKVLKRKFSLAKLSGDMATVKRLVPILNSDYGRLYHVISDIDAIIFLLDENKKVPLESVQYAVNQLIGRLSNIYTMKDFLKKEDAIVKTIINTMELPRSQMLVALLGLRDMLNDILQSAVRKDVKNT